MAYSTSSKTYSSEVKMALISEAFLLGAGRGLRNTSVESCVQPQVEERSTDGCDLKLACLKPGIQ